MNKNLGFDYNNLFNKAKLYVHRAFDEDRESDLFPFWISLSLELLARSTLSKISPTLLADASQNATENILYALGYESTNDPRSIPTILVFNRLKKIGIPFTGADEKLAQSIIGQRNMELHSGLRAYRDFPISIWLGDYYRICKLLLASQGLDLKDFFGSSEAEAAEEMIKDDIRKVKKEVMDKIQQHKKSFSGLDEKKKKELIDNSLVKMMGVGIHFKTIECPACKSQAPMHGQLISQSQPKLDVDRITRERRYLPIQVQCFVCGLKICGYPEMKAVDLGAQFTVTDNLDPVDYHDIDIDSMMQEKYPGFDGADFSEYLDE